MRKAAILALFSTTACYGGTTTHADTDSAEGSSSGADASSGVDSSSAGSSAGTTGNDSGNDSDDSAGGSTGGDTGVDDEPTDDPLDGLPTGQDQWEALCARGHADPIAVAICAGDSPPTIGSLAELRDLIGLDFADVNAPPSQNGNPGITFNYHSTAVSTRFVNAVNPRAFIFTPPVGGVTFPPSGVPNPDLTVMAFTRGEPFVELVANDPVDDELRFYLFRFNLPCEQTVAGCDNGDMLTPSVESGFTDYSLYDDADIGNTVLDCLQCHQPDGPGTLKMLRMQELEEGWHHWFYPNRPQNRVAMTQFLAAHEGEQYGGIPAEYIDTDRFLNSNEGVAAPVAFSLMVTNQGFATQPNEYDTRAIRTERDNNGCTCNGCTNPPPMDPTDSCSPTWDAMFAASLTGDEIAAPYFDGHIADPAKIANATSDYLAVMQGQMAGDQMADLRDVIWDGGEPYMSFAPAPGLDARQMMQQMCQHCHNSSLDQTISRSNFDVENFDSLPQHVKDEAVRRLMLPVDDIERMPPERFHTLSDADKNLLIQELQP